MGRFPRRVWSSRIFVSPLSPTQSFRQNGTWILLLLPSPQRTRAAVADTASRCAPLTTRLLTLPAASSCRETRSTTPRRILGACGFTTTTTTTTTASVVAASTISTPQNNNNNNKSSGSGSSLSPSHSFPLNWYYGLSSDADYYGHGTAPVFPAEIQKLCSPLDCNSYSPQDSFSSSSSSCYDSPTRIESSHQSFASEQYQHYQQCNHQDCYCLPHCWSGQQDGFSGPECTSYSSSTDYPYTCLVEENYRRDLQMSPEMCYNVL
ncbi:colorectal cancer associated 2 isoform X1 [Cynoglossus semilaevis]|uniref:colorectal cancer associated 2 isoform X1 n=1 Tax=Cynoglossus semilaevis TaxID=244447 RepID=UPI0007DCACC7|nr:uncharacterized protein LOC103377776 isoform X1 [Cynoglossus semilaevis]